MMPQGDITDWNLSPCSWKPTTPAIQRQTSVEDKHAQVPRTVAEAAQVPREVAEAAYPLVT